MLEALKDILIPNAAPESILLDFEIAAQNAFHYVFPNSNISGCFCHLCKSKARELGLKIRIQNDPEFSTLVKSLAAFSFVPTAEVVNIFEILINAFPQNNDVDVGKLMMLMLTLFVNYFIISSRRMLETGNLPPESGNQGSQLSSGSTSSMLRSICLRQQIVLKGFTMR